MLKVPPDKVKEAPFKKHAFVKIPLEAFDCTIVPATEQSLSIIRPVEELVIVDAPVKLILENEIVPLPELVKEPVYWGLPSTVPATPWLPVPTIDICTEAAETIIVSAIVIFLTIIVTPAAPVAPSAIACVIAAPKVENVPCDPLVVEVSTT